MINDEIVKEMDGDGMEDLKEGDYYEKSYAEDHDS